ncbi:methyltransferase domain-containing protein [Candidatus Poribacteria bacterium]|nr:methyltransferase domain-containing protein [Candidatus Poribacteria bacterium]
MIIETYLKLSRRSLVLLKENIKNKVKEFWNRESCGTGVALSRKFTRQYFDEIEDYRYKVEPEVFSFAQFTRFRDKDILEVGVGSGTDFLQWVRAGARAYGVDLTEEAVEHVRHRLEIYGLIAEDIRVADAEDLPYPDNRFDLVYSWGVIHHSPDTIKALEEIIRVTRIGGTAKIMVYNKKSLNAFYQYIKYGLMRGRPFKSISWILYHYMESIGTKAFTINEMKRILTKYPVRIIDIAARVNYYDLLPDKSPFARFIAYLLACLLGYNKIGWFLTVEIEKTGN